MEATWVHQHSSRASMRTDTRSDGSSWSVHGHLALVALDKVRDGIAKTIIIDHWRESGGRVPAFGGIMGYVLVLVAGHGGFDLGLPFSVTGDQVGAMQKVERLGEAALGTRRGDMR